MATLQPASGDSMDAHLCIICGPLGGVDSVLNVLLFIPLGIGLALSDIPFRRTCLVACALSLTVETTQLFFITGRDATVGDVVTNTLGAAVGFGLARSARFWLRPATGIAAFLSLGWAALWVLIQILSAFALAPSNPGSIFYGELAPELGNFDLFRGRVMAATIGGVAIRDAHLSEADLAGHQFRGRDLVAVTVAPSYAPEGIAPILRLVDAEQREIVLLAQHGREMIFAFHTGAADLRLRPPIFGLRGAFPLAPTSGAQRRADSLMLAGRYTREVILSAQTPTETSGSQIPVTISLGWTLVLPAQWFIEGTVNERILSWVWLAFLVLPIGYWAARAMISRVPETVVGSYATIWAAVAVFVAAGLGVTPIAFGLSPTPIGDWLAAVGGLMLGVGLARRFRGINQADLSGRD
ncbi:MAG: VanZ family protein [Gemmatimonadaceae bacterium]